MSKQKWNNEDFILAVKESYSYAEIMRKLGLQPAGGNYDKIKRTIKQLNLDTTHMTGQGWNNGIKYKNPRPPMPIEEILVENSSYVSSNSLRKRLLKEKIKEPKCECCGATEWLGKPIALELHHVNGIKDDLRIENLQILCPNCHAFTDNYRGKNQGKSAQKETSDVEPLKFKETLTGDADGNLEPSLIKKSKKGAETRREESKPLIKYYCAYCGKEIARAKHRQKYCSQECAHAVVSKRPGITELLEAFKTYKSYVQVGKHFNVSDNAVHKWVQLYKIKDMIKEQSSLQTE